MKNVFTRLNLSEKKFLLILSISIILITLLPIIYAYINANDGTIYNGTHSLTYGDFPVYFSYINQIKNGEFLLSNNFAIENQGYKIFNIFWLFAGSLAKLFRLSPAVVMQLIRISLIPFTLFILYQFVSIIFIKQNTRKLTMLFLCFSSGIGGYAIPFLLQKSNTADSRWPIDFWIAESNTFLTLYHLPHTLLSLTLMILIFILLISALQYKKIRYAFYAGLIGLIHFNFHPYYFVSINAIFGIYLIWKLLIKELNFAFSIKLFLAWFIPSTISILYHYFLILKDPIIGGRASQNLTLTPPFLYILLGYGLLLFFSLLGLFYAYKNRKELPKHMDFIIIWFIVGFLTLYLPITFQRRFFQGLQIPLVILTVYSFTYIKNKIFIKIKKNVSLSIMLFIIFFGFSPLTNVMRDITYFNQNLSHFYHTNNFVEMISWLKINNKGVLLSDDALQQNTYNSLSPSFWISAYTQQSVYISHSHETPNYINKLNQISDINKKNNPNDWMKFYTKNNIEYILLNKNNLKKNIYNYQSLKEVYNNNEYIIFTTNINLAQ